MTTVPLRQSAFATVGANGRAVANLQPLRAFERWEITRTTVACTSTVLAPTARTYRGFEAAGSLIDATGSGRNDTSDTIINLENGEQLIVVWEGKTVGAAGADVGARCTVTVEGKAIRDAI